MRLLMALAALALFAPACGDDSAPSDAPTDTNQTITPQDAIASPDSGPGTVDDTGATTEDGAASTDAEGPADNDAGPAEDAADPFNDDAETGEDAGDPTEQDAGPGEDTATPEPDVEEDSAAGTDVSSTEDAGPTDPCGGADQACCEGDVCDDGLACSSAGFCGPVLPECTEGECVELPEYEPEATITKVAGQPPTLTGGEMSESTYTLVEAEVYAEACMGALANSLTIEDNGGTGGVMRFDAGDRWGLDANLNIRIYGTVVVVDLDQLLEQSLVLGGCQSTDGAQMSIAIDESCGEWSLPDSEPPSGWAFELTETGLDIILVLDREFIIASMPEEYQALAGNFITNDLPVLLRFVLQQDE